MRLKIEIHLEGVNDIAIDDSTSTTVATPVSFIRSLREESNMVTFANDDYSDFRIYFHLGACFYKREIVSVAQDIHCLSYS